MECVATILSTIHYCDNEFFRIVRRARLGTDTFFHVIVGKKIDFIRTNTVIENTQGIQ